MRRLLIVVALSLFFAGAAWAMNPSSLTVRRGSLLGGNVASLYSVDGNTLDVASAVWRGNYVVVIHLSFSEADSYLHYAARADPFASCRFYGLGNPRAGIVVTFGQYLLSTGVLHFVAPYSDVVVRCKSDSPAQPYTVYFDELTLASS